MHYWGEWGLSAIYNYIYTTLKTVSNDSDSRVDNFTWGAALYTTHHELVVFVFSAGIKGTLVTLLN